MNGGPQRFVHEFSAKLDEALRILRHVEAARAERDTAGIRSAIRQIEELIEIAKDAGLFGKVPANSNEDPSH